VSILKEVFYCGSNLCVDLNGEIEEVKYQQYDLLSKDEEEYYQQLWRKELTPDRRSGFD
jgi:hypothetical protein